jgi:hypothetical protein
MTTSELALRGFANTALWCEHSLTIRNKAGIPVPLRLSPSQLKLDEAVTRSRKQGIPGRHVWTKGRQVHMSVAAVLQIFRAVAFMEGQNAIILANDHKTNTNLFNYFKQFVDSYVPWCGIEMLKVESINTTAGNQEIRFAGGGRVLFGSAKTFTVARGFSIRAVLLSEASYYPPERAAETTAGLLSAVPDDLDTLVIVESTGYGQVGFFYELFSKANDPRANRGDWRAGFFGWHEHPENILALNCSREEFEASLDETEKLERQKYNLSLEQLAWRRKVIHDKCNGNIRLFRQEHPANALEAFQAGGRARFDSTRVDRWIPQHEATTYDLDLEQVGLEKRPVARPRLDGGGALKIFVQPKPATGYVIGADSAQGIDVAERGADANPDYSVAHVMDCKSGQQVAIWRDRVTPAEFARVLAALGQLYGWAFLCPESNNDGKATIQALLATSYPPSLIYHRDRAPDNMEPKTTVELGWLTTQASRPILISAIETALLEVSSHLYCPVAIHEHRIFQTSVKGKAQAPPGQHDDCVFAHGLALVALPQARWAFDRLERARKARQLDKRSEPGARYGAGGQQQERGRRI